MFAELDRVLRHPLLAPLRFVCGTSGFGAVERSFQIEPTLPRLRPGPPLLDPAPPSPPPYTRTEAAAVRALAAQHQQARPPPAAFTEPFVPALVKYSVRFWPYTPQVKKAAERALPKPVLEKMREKKWRETTINQDPPMWHLLKHPFL